MSRAEPWWVPVFLEPFPRGMIQLQTPEEVTRDQVDFLVERLELTPGMHVLDLACGHGLHAVELARRGFQVTGLDLSEPALAHARGAAKEAGVEVDWVQADMRAVPFSDRFDAVVNLFTAFGYFEDEAEDEGVLREVAKALKPGGLFLVDTVNLLWLAQSFVPASVRELDDGSVLVENREYDVLSGRTSSRILLVESDGQRVEYAYNVRIYSYTELAAMLRRTGLAPEQAWGDWTGVELGFEGRRMIVRARKSPL